jgi:tetratricopeptide (TPR) repeat protein
MMRYRFGSALLSLALSLVAGCAREPAAPPAVSYTDEGKALAKAGKITEAVVAFNRGIALEPKIPAPYIGLAVLYESVNRPDLAIETLEQLRAANPEAKGLRVRLAEAYLGADDLKAARAWGEQAVAEGTDAVRAHSVYGITMVRFRYWDTAIEHLQKAWELDPTEINVPVVLMEAHIQRGDYVKAAEVGEAVLKQTGDSARLRYKLGWAYARQPQRPEARERAIAHLKKAAELSPDWFEPCAELGRLYLGQGKTQEARQQFERAWQLNRAAPGVAFNLATLRRQQGDPRYKEVETAFQRLMKAQERFTALRRGYNSDSAEGGGKTAIELAASEGESRLYGAALHRLRKLLAETPSHVAALALYTRLDQEARAGYPNYLRPGPGISAPGL